MISQATGGLKLTDTGTAVGYATEKTSTPTAWAPWFRHEWASSTSAASASVGTSLREAVRTLMQAAMALRTAEEGLEPVFFEPIPHGRRSVGVRVEYRGRARPRLFVDDEADE